MAGAQPAADICLVLLVGLPGSGKTTLVNFIKQHFTNEKEATDEHPSLNVIHICYDDLIKSSLVFSVSSEGGIWRDARKEVLSMVEKLICMLKGLFLEKRTERLLLKYEDENKYIKTNCEWNVDSTRKTLIVIDDNMYYSSMRYSYFQLARCHCLGFYQLYIECSVASALLHNKQRPLEERVPDEVIIKMGERIELPQGKPWEEWLLSIKAHEQYLNHETVKHIERMTLRAFLNPVKPVDNLSEFRGVSREACMASTVHQCDLALRHLVNQRMKLSQQKSCSSEELKTQSKVLKMARVELLEAIKSGQIIIPKELDEAIKNCDPVAVDLQTFLSTLLP